MCFNNFPFDFAYQRRFQHLFATFVVPHSKVTRFDEFSNLNSLLEPIMKVLCFIEEVFNLDTVFVDLSTAFGEGTGGYVVVYGLFFVFLAIMAILHMVFVIIVCVVFTHVLFVVVVDPVATVNGVRHSMAFVCLGVFHTE